MSSLSTLLTTAFRSFTSRSLPEHFPFRFYHIVAILESPDVVDTCTQWSVDTRQQPNLSTANVVNHKFSFGDFSSASKGS
jgi:hypothetical protein